MHEENPCDICGGFAGFETSPEGEACATCSNWVCEEHVDWAYMRKLHIETGKEYAYPICTQCAKEGRRYRER